MNTPKRVLEIHNPQNKHILLANDLADLLGIKRRLQTINLTKRFKSLTNYFLHCDLLDKNGKIFKENPQAFLDASTLSAGNSVTGSV